MSLEIPGRAIPQTPGPAMELSDREWLTTGQAAAALGVRSATVARWIKSGRLPGTRHLKGWVVPRREVMQLLQAPRSRLSSGPIV